MPKTTKAHTAGAESATDASPLYLYTGAETGERDEAIKQMTLSMKKAFGSVEERTYYATETPVSEVLTAVQGVSLFDGSVCVVLKSAEVIKKKEDVTPIIEWAKTKGDGSSALILVSDENSIDAKIEKAVYASHKKIFYEMFDNRKVPYITDFFRRAGYSLTSDAAQDILDMIENNTAVLKAECSRFFALFPKGHCITEDDVEAVLSHDREESAFTLFDAMAGAGAAAGRLEKALGILSKIRLSKDNSSVMLIAGLASCFRRLMAWHSVAPSGDEARLRSAGFASRRAREQYGRAARIWTQGESCAILADLCNTDTEIRSTGSGMEDTLLTAMLYRIIVKKGARLSEYS